VNIINQTDLLLLIKLLFNKLLINNITD